MLYFECLFYKYYVARVVFVRCQVKNKVGYHNVDWRSAESSIRYHSVSPDVPIIMNLYEYESNISITYLFVYRV